MGNLFVAQPLAQQHQDLQLAVGEGFDEPGVGSVNPGPGITGLNLLLRLREHGQDAAHGLGKALLGKALLGQPVQHSLHGCSQIDESPDDAAGPREAHRLLQCGERIAGLPLRLERQGTQGQDLDVEADAEGALGDLMQRVQDVQRRLRIRVRASCQ